MFFICLASAVIIPYLICSLNPAIIITKLKSGQDIRELGSGNPGLTNTMRTQGKGAALFVLLFDVFKGAISIFIVMICTFHSHQSFYIWTAALFSVIGHCYPVYYKFKGGKAVLVTVATGLVIEWLAALIALLLFILIVKVSKYVSLGSIIAAIAYPICIWLVGAFVWGRENVLIGVTFTSVIGVLLIIKHKDNIRRLIAGTEKKITDKDKFHEKDE